MNMHDHTRRIIRQSLLFLLVLCLLPTVSLPALAEDKPVTNLFGSALMDTYDNIVSAVRVGDTCIFKRITPCIPLARRPGCCKLVNLSEQMWNYGVEDPSASASRRFPPCSRTGRPCTPWTMKPKPFTS